MVSRVLVTGAAGFIGSHLCESLLNRGLEVVGLDNFDPFYDPNIKRANLRASMSFDRFSLVEGDIRDLECLAHVFRDPVDAVVHLAAKAGVRPSVADPLSYQDVNIRGTVALLEAVKRSTGCRFVFGSSSSVYGNNAKVPFSEDDPLESMQSPYAATKRCGELLCRTYHHLYGTPITCLRFFTVYGPRQRPDLAIHKFVRLIERGRPLPVYGDGRMRRDFTYIEDIVSGVVGALQRCEGFSIYNLGNSSPVSVSELVGLIEEATGSVADLRFEPQPPGDVRQTYADITRAARDLGYRPVTGLAVGLRRFVDWYRSRDAAGRH